MTSNETRTISELPPETIDFAHCMFDTGREKRQAAVDAGLSPHLRNQKDPVLSAPPCAPQ